MLLGLVGQEGFQLGVAGQLVGIGSAHTVVRLDHHRVAHFLHELLAACQIVHHVIAGGGDAGLLVILLHLALVLDAGHIRGLEAGSDVEIGAQGGVPLQPVFIVGLQPVDGTVLEGKKGHSAVDLIVVFQTAHLVVFVQAVLQLRLQLIVGLVADAQHVHAIVLQLPAELPVVGGEVRRDKNKILHGIPILLSSIKAASPSPSARKARVHLSQRERPWQYGKAFWFCQRLPLWGSCHRR